MLSTQGTTRCVKVSTHPQGRRGLRVFFLSVVSHEADLAQALVCWTDLVDVEMFASCALDPEAIRARSRRFLQRGMGTAGTKTCSKT